MSTPLKRHPSLVALSKDHHHGLLLCWKIREAQKKGTETARVKKYLDFFFENHLSPHFQFEEEEVFPLLGKEHDLVRQAYAEHRRLRSLFSEEEELEKVMADIEKELQVHIRFEERELFQEIQQTVPEEDLQKLAQKEENVTTVDPDDWNDKFWLKES